MRFLFIIFLTLQSFAAISQEIFSYERKIDTLKLYNHQEYKFLNDADKINLSGTLIAPRTEYSKVAIIIPGSGKDTRYSHFILAEKLLEAGVAVFRFDERGAGKSEGKYSELASDLSMDLKYCYDGLLHELPDKKIGFIGHSLGGMAALQAVKNLCDPNFLVLIETPIIKNGSFILNQIEMDYDNALPEVIRKGKSKAEILTFLKSYFATISNNPLEKRTYFKQYIKNKNFNSKFIALMDDMFLMEMLRISQEDILKGYSGPTLYVSGTKNKVINHLQEIELVASFKSPNIVIKTYEGLNHWLTDRNAVVGSSLYQMDEEPLREIIMWILKN